MLGKGPYMSHASACGRKYVKGRDLHESAMLQILFYLQTGRRRVETLRNFLFAAPYSRWEQENFNSKLTPDGFNAAFYELYSRKLMRPWVEDDERTLHYVLELLFERFEEFEITRSGTDLITKHLKRK
jgi:hypothetical protein